jgi:hypothetical protein
MRELVAFIIPYAISQTIVFSLPGRSTHEHIRRSGLPFHSHFAPPQPHKFSIFCPAVIRASICGALS